MSSLYAKLQERLHFSDYTTALIWSLGTALLTGLTLKDFVPLLADYVHNNVATQIAVLQEKTTRPNVSVCLFYYSNALDNIADWIQSGSTRNWTECEECQAMADHGWDVWNDTNFPSRIIKNTLANILIREVLTKNLTTELLILNRTNFNWNQPIVDAFWTLISCMTYMDQNVVVPNENLTYYSVFCNGLNLTDLEPLLTPDIDSIYNVIIQTLETYLQCWPGYYRHSLDFGRIASIPIKVEDRAEFSAKGPLGFCFPLLQNSSAEYFGYKAFPDGHKPPWMPRRKKHYTMLKESTRAMYAFGHVFDNLYETDENSVEHVNREEVKMAYEIGTRVIEKRTNKECSEEPEPSLCMTRKMLDDVIGMCGCIPFTLKRLLDGSPKGLPYCITSIYGQCHKKVQANAEKYRTECNNLCQHIRYKWTTTFTTTNDRSMDYTGFVAVQPVASPFLEFSLVNKNTPEQFLAQMGGLINFYLGFSGLSVCAAVVYCVRLFKSRKTMGSNNLSEKMEEVLRELQNLRTESESVNARIARLEKRL